MSDVLSPQQRWENFRATKLPYLSKRQQWGLIGISVLLLLAVVVFVLPYLLPLLGPATVAPHSLADEHGTFLDLNGQQIYSVHLANDGPAVVLIHGQGGSTLTWQDTMPALHQVGFDVYALDLPGMGLSQKGFELDYSHEASVEIIRAFLDAQDLDQAHIVAHAFSGNVATWFALAYPEQVSTLTLVAPTLITDPSAQVPPFLFDLPFLERWARVLLQLVLPEAVGEQLRSATKIDEVVTDDLIDDYSRLLYTENWEYAILGMLRDSHLNTLPGVIESIPQPVLLLWGTDDGWATPNNATWMLVGFPNAEFVSFEGIGHLPMHEVPQAFNAALINFLSKQQGDVDGN